jgi:uncharacterized MAPEG superfamily protein
MDKLSVQNALFNTYAIAASIMILKAVMMSWLTVARMMQVNGGFRSPEDIKKTILNPNPNAEQLAPNEYVDRIRRIQLNDLENLPFFLAAGFLFILDRAFHNARPMAAVWLRHFSAVAFCRLFHSKDSRYTRNALDGQFSDPDR